MAGISERPSESRFPLRTILSLGLMRLLRHFRHSKILSPGNAQKVTLAQGCVETQKTPGTRVGAPGVNSYPWLWRTNPGLGVRSREQAPASRSLIAARSASATTHAVAAIQALVAGAVADRRVATAIARRRIAHHLSQMRSTPCLALTHVAARCHLSRDRAACAIISAVFFG